MRTLSSTGRMGVRPRPFKRRHSHTKSKTQERSAIYAAHAFLSQSFEPVTDLAFHKKDKVVSIEERIFIGLTNLGILHGFSVKKFSRLTYPFNIAASYEDASKKLKKRSPQLELLLTEKKDGSISVATAREFDTNRTLYYMPMDALVHLHRHRDSQAFWLLVSCYAYLHQCAGMPLCGEYSYVDDCYRMNEESMEDEAGRHNTDEFAESLWDIRRAKRCLPILNKLLKDPGQLQLFHKRVERYQATLSWEKELHAGATELLRLYREFPKRSFRDHTSGELLHEQADQKGYIEMYFSFCWTVDGWMIDQLIEYVNCDLQERDALDQPVSLQFFNEPQQKEEHAFPFETALTGALDGLVDALNHIV